MKHLYFIVATVLLPLLTSCHTKKQAIETVREETNTSRQTLFLIDSGKLDSMRTSFLAEFDSLVIEMPGTPIQCPGAGIVPDTATAPPPRQGKGVRWQSQHRSKKRECYFGTHAEGRHGASPKSASL